MIKILCVIFFLSFAARAEEPGLSTYQLNNGGVGFLQAQNYSAAQDKFIQALGKNPFLAPLHLNLGLAFYGLQQIDKAEASFLTAAGMGADDQTKFIALFNLGELNGKAKKIDQALGYYQQALDLKPDSLETKINIELLIQDQQDQKGQGGQSDKKNDQNKDPDKDKKDEGNEGEKKDKDEKGEEKDKPKQYEKNKPQPKPFKSDELTQGDVNKILGELKQQEQKIRSEFNRRDVKEKPRDKDW